MQGLTLRILARGGDTFTAGGRRYTLWPQSLGGTLLLERELRALTEGEGPAGEGAALWALRLSRNRREWALRVIARATSRTRKEHLSQRHQERRARELGVALDTEETATLLLAVMREAESETLRRESGLKEEQATLGRLSRLRNEEGGTEHFGGRTLIGSLVDAACSRYGWSVGYTVWGVSLDQLRMLLWDRSECVYISDEERRKTGMAGIGEIDAESADIETLRRLTEE